MAVDMKETIAEAARKLLMEKKVKKLTVKDIVETCEITRQAFYYHFADIPDLLQWVIEREKDQLLKECRACDNEEEGLRYLLLIAINAAPHVKRSIKSSYGTEIEQLLIRNIYSLFEQIAEEKNLYETCSEYDLDLIFRYHSYAVMGILWYWTEEDTKNIDRVVHEIYVLMTEGLPPFITK